MTAQDATLLGEPLMTQGCCLSLDTNLRRLPGGELRGVAAHAVEGRGRGLGRDDRVAGGRAGAGLPRSPRRGPDPLGRPAGARPRAGPGTDPQATGLGAARLLANPQRRILHRPALRPTGAQRAGLAPGYRWPGRPPASPDPGRA